MISFSREEVRRNLLGALEVALFMPEARNRFSTSADEAIRSFMIPTLLLPATLLLVYIFPRPELADDSANTIAFLYSLRMVLSWVMFLGCIYWLVNNVNRREYFCQFVTATNWLTIPATLIYLPVALMIAGGAYSWTELYPFTVCLTVYTYAFTAFMAAYILRVPWELAGFVAVISVMVDNYTSDLIAFVSDKL